MNTRIETDTMGEVAVPTEAYWGAQTQRAAQKEDMPATENCPKQMLIELSRRVPATPAEKRRSERQLSPRCLCPAPQEAAETIGDMVTGKDTQEANDESGPEVHQPAGSRRTRDENRKLFRDRHTESTQHQNGEDQ